MITLHQLLKATVKQDASDLHIVAGSAPALRVKGRMVRVKSTELSGEDTRRICYSILTDIQKSRFEEDKEIDFSFSVKRMARFRVNLSYQKGVVSGVFRKIQMDVPDINTLGIPKGVIELTKIPFGLILVTGPTGCGKTTTLAALLDKVNKERRGHIVTLEDPIEYVHMHKNCIINQREIGTDTNSFEAALRHILRQDPDVCLLGELRDALTVQSALRIAETGHLVFATLHTNSALQSISRMVGMFPADQQDRERNVLSHVLSGVLSQRLVPTVDGELIAACEFMQVNSAIRNLIREDKLHQIYGMMQVGQDKSGMITLNQSLAHLTLKRKIKISSAFNASPDPEELDLILSKMGV